jgi:hypothetical protein
MKPRQPVGRKSDAGAKSSPAFGTSGKMRRAQLFADLFSPEKGFFIAPNLTL